MIGVSALTAADALAAMEWLVEEANEHGEINFDSDLLYSRVVKSLMNAVRDYLARQVE